MPVNPFPATPGQTTPLDPTYFISGTGEPEGVIIAIPGVLYIQTDGPHGARLWIKETGVGNTGWGLVGAGSLGMLNVKDYGAIGDGVTDDEPAIQAVIDLVSSLPRGTRPTIWLPASTYLINKPLRMKTHELTLAGDGWNNSRIIGSGGGGPLLVCYANEASAIYPGYNYLDAQARMAAPLLTGSGYSFNTNHPNTLTNYQSWFHMRDCLASLQPNGMSAFCVEFTTKLQTMGQPIGAPQSGAFLGSAGSRYTGDPVASAFQIYHTDTGVLRAEMTIGATKYLLIGGAMSVGVQYHIALTYDGANIRLFLNGVIQATQAVVGTITQKYYEDLCIGVVNTNYSEAGRIMNPASAYIDGVRFSNVARYTAGFTPPTAKWTLDGNTLVILNFDEQFDIFTVARTSYGDAYVVLRDDTHPGFSVWITIHDLQLDGVGFVSPSGSGHRGCLAMIGTPEYNIQNVKMYSYTYGALLLHDTFASRMTNVSAFIPGAYGLYGFLFGPASGLTTVYGAHVTGGQVCIACIGTNMVFMLPWIETGSGSTICAILSAGFGAEDAGFTMIGGGVNAESGGFLLEQGWLIGDSQAQIMGGTFEHGLLPAVELQGCTGFMAISVGFHPNDATTEPVIKIGRDCIGPVTLMNCRKLPHTPTLASGIDWCDKPEQIVLINVDNNRRVKPLVEGCLIQFMTSSIDIDVDVALTNRFTVKVKDNSAFEILSPVNPKSGQTISITVENLSGGAMGAITWGLNYGMSAWTNPAADFSRSIQFLYNGLGWTEIGRTPADVPVPTANPSSFADLAIWLDANTLVLADTNPVVTWFDQSVNGNDVTQADAGKRPIYRTNQINGLPAVDFPGVDEYLAAPDDVTLRPTGNHSFFVVMSIDTTPSGINYLLAGKNKLTEGGVAWYLANGAPYFVESVYDGATIQNFSSSPAVTPTTWYLVETIFDGTEYKLYHNGVLKVTLPGNPAGMTVNNPFYVGGESTDSWLDGKIAELVMYTTDLSTDQRQQLEQYFARKYALDIGASCE